MISSKQLKLIALVAAVPLVLTACGGGGDGGGGQTVSASEYAAGICGEMSNWLDAIQAQTSQLQDIPATASIEERRAALADYLDAIVAATDDLVAGASEVGTPDVSGGADVAEQILAAFEDAQTALVDARAEVDQLPVDDPAAFTQAATDLGTSIQTTLGDIGDSLSGLSQADVDQAFSEEPACQNLGS